MTFNNYQIPQNITAEEEFMYNLQDKFYSVGSHTGFVIGAFSRLIDIMEDNNVPAKIVKEAEDVFEFVVNHINEYSDISNFSYERWKELGKPLSLAAHQAKKERLDKEDEYKSEYLDR